MADLKAYLSLGSCRSGMWLSENKIVFINTDNEGRSIVTKDLLTGTEEILFSTHERIWSVYTDEKTGHIFFTSDVGGTENEQIFVIKNGTKDPVNVTNDPASRHNLGKLLPDGKTLVMASNAREKKTFDITKVNIDTLEKGMILQNNDNYNSPRALSPNGQYLLYNKMLGSSNNAMWMVDVNTGETIKVPQNTEIASYSNAVWKSDSSGFYLITDFDSNYSYIAYYDLAKKTLEKIYSCDWDVENIALSHDDRYLAIAINEGGYSNLIVYDFKSLSFLNIPAPPKGVYALHDKLSWSIDGYKLLFSLSSGKRPPDLWLMDIKADSLKKITDCYKAGLTSDDLIEPILGEFTSFDGLKVPYWLYVPASLKAENLPIVIEIHGGPEGQSLPGGSGFLQYMVSQGIAVCAPNVRGSVGYGKEYAHLDDVEKRLDSVKDIEYLVKHLIETGTANKDKLAVSGASYGGFMTLSCAARYPELWCCAIDTVGIFNLVTFLENTADYRRPHREAEYGSLALHRDILLKVSPIDKVDDIKGPLMIIHGENDPRVPVSEAHQAKEYLSKRGVEVELLIYSDEGHGIVKLKNKLDCYPKVIEFTKKHMKI